MSMSKKDFIALADAIKEHNRIADQRERFGSTKDHFFSEDQISSLADFCEDQNPNFKRDRWLDYIAGNCGPNGGAIK